MRPALFGLLALVACDAPDYTPVRDWSEKASLAVDYRTASLGAAAEAASIRAQQEALAIYFTDLGIIAGDGVIPTRENPFKSQLTQLSPADAALRDPMNKLGEQLAHSSRMMDLAPQMRDMITAADPKVQSLITGLIEAVARQAEKVSATAAPRDAVVQQAAAAQYRQVLAEVAAGHALLKTRAPKITQPEAVYYIRFSQQSLQRAAEALPRPAMLTPTR